MTVHDLMRLVIRRWYIFVLGLACAITGSIALKSEPWTYVANTEFVMNSPVSSLDFEAPEDTRNTLISFADVVSRKFNAEEFTQPLSSPSATLFGNGLRKGTSVKLLNSGTQWQSSYSGPVISVQVIDSTDAAVQQELDDIAVKIKRITKNVQDELGVANNSQISAETDPTRTVISAFGPTKTSRIKGVVLLICLSLGISMLIARGLDSWVSRKTCRQSTATGELSARTATGISRQSVADK